MISLETIIFTLGAILEVALVIGLVLFIVHRINHHG